MKPLRGQVVAGVGMLILLAFALCIGSRRSRNHAPPDNSDDRGSSGDLREIELRRVPEPTISADSPIIAAVSDNPLELRLRSLVATYAQDLALRRTEVWDPDLRRYESVPAMDGAARDEIYAMVKENPPGVEPLLIKLFDEARTRKLRAGLVHLLGWRQPQSPRVRQFQLRIVSEDRDEHLVELGIQALLWSRFCEAGGRERAGRGRYGGPCFEYERYNAEGVLVPRRSWVLPGQFLVDSQDIDPETMSCIMGRMGPASADYVHEVIVSLIRGCRGQPEYTAALARLLPHLRGNVRTKLAEDLWRSDDPAMRLLAQENSRVMENVYLSTEPGYASVKHSAYAPIYGTTQVVLIRVLNASGAVTLTVTIEVSQDGLTWRTAEDARISAPGTRELTLIDKRKEAVYWRLRAEVTGANVSVVFAVSMNWS